MQNANNKLNFGSELTVGEKFCQNRYKQIKKVHLCFKV